MFSEEGAHVLRSERVSTPLPWRTARGKSTGPAHSRCSHTFHTVRHTRQLPASGARLHSKVKEVKDSVSHSAVCDSVRPRGL